MRNSTQDGQILKSHKKKNCTSFATGKGENGAMKAKERKRIQEENYLKIQFCSS